jgi:hypothetical protein
LVAQHPGCSEAAGVLCVPPAQMRTRSDQHDRSPLAGGFFSAVATSIPARRRWPPRPVAGRAAPAAGDSSDTRAAACRRVAANASRRTPATARPPRAAGSRGGRGNRRPRLRSPAAWESAAVASRSVAAVAPTPSAPPSRLCPVRGPASATDSRHAEGCGHVPLLPALLFQVPGPSPTNLTPIRGRVCVHAANGYHKSTTTPLATSLRISGSHR